MKNPKMRTLFILFEILNQYYCELIQFNKQKRQNVQNIPFKEYNYVCIQYMLWNIRQWHLTKFLIQYKKSGKIDLFFFKFSFSLLLPWLVTKLVFYGKKIHIHDIKKMLEQWSRLVSQLLQPYSRIFYPHRPQKKKKKIPS